jgi:hypothetical protein
MQERLNSVQPTTFSGDHDRGLQMRLLCTMMIAVALAVIVSLFLSPWRVTLGLLLGGLLSLLNYHWMRRSIAAGFSVALDGSRPRITVAQYILRYFVIGAVIFVAYRFKVVSLPAAVAGLCSFVVALFVEASKELYFAIIQREEIG